MRVLSRRFLVTTVIGQHALSQGEVRPRRAVRTARCLLNSPRPRVIQEVAGGNPFSCPPVRFGDVIFHILKANAPQAPPTDLDGAQLSTADQAPDEARLHVELFDCLLDCQEAALCGFVCRRFILCPAPDPARLRS
jgi:hypothetical protein